MFYLFEQNNSYGRFDVDDKLCHRLFIEADDAEEARLIAERLGCYWNGVDEGIDCPCCGDRWDCACMEINIDKYRTEGYAASVLETVYRDPAAIVAEWNRKYGEFVTIGEPHFRTLTYCDEREYVGYIKFSTIEEYAQFVADDWGWTTPDVRIFFKNGELKEIFSKEIID